MACAVDLNYVLQLPKEHLALQSGVKIFTATFVQFAWEPYETDFPPPQQMTASPSPDGILPFCERDSNPPVFGCSLADKTLGIATSLPRKGKK